MAMVEGTMRKTQYGAMRYIDDAAFANKSPEEVQQDYRRINQAVWDIEYLLAEEREKAQAAD